jgi:hypothetical protein
MKKPEVRRQKPEVGRKKTEVRSRKTEVGSKNFGQYIRMDYEYQQKYNIENE